MNANWVSDITSQLLESTNLASDLIHMVVEYACYISFQELSDILQNCVLQKKKCVRIVMKGSLQVNNMHTWDSCRLAKKYVDFIKCDQSQSHLSFKCDIVFTCEKLHYEKHWIAMSPLEYGMVIYNTHTANPALLLFEGFILRPNRALATCTDLSCIYFCDSNLYYRPQYLHIKKCYEKHFEMMCLCKIGNNDVTTKMYSCQK